MPYYESPEMLREHIKYWLQYPIWLASKVGVILVDDGSPTKPAEEVLRSATLPYFPIELYRIKENIPWNHGGARNLGMHVLPHPKTWALSTDIDLILSAEHLERLLPIVNARLPRMRKGTVYFPGRLGRTEDGTWVGMKPHRETFIMTKELFWAIGGYDEDFTGYWNGVWRGFIRTMNNKATVVHLQDIQLLSYDGFKDANVVDWGRNGSEWDIKTKPEMNKIRRIAVQHYHPKNPLRFTWERVFSSGCEIDEKS